MYALTLHVRRNFREKKNLVLGEIYYKFSLVLYACEDLRGSEVFLGGLEGQQDTKAKHLKVRNDLSVDVECSLSSFFPFLSSSHCECKN